MSLEIKERKWKLLSRVQLFVTPWSIVHGILQARILEGLSLLQGIFPTQGSNWGLLHCRRILYQLSYREAQEKDLFNQFSLNGLPHKVHCREITDQQNTSVLQGWEARNQNSELWEQLWLYRNPGGREPEKEETKNLHIMVPKILA